MTTNIETHTHRLIPIHEQSDTGDQRCERHKEPKLKIQMFFLYHMHV